MYKDDGVALGCINVAPLGLAQRVGLCVLMCAVPRALPWAVLMSPRWGLPRALGFVYSQGVALGFFEKYEWFQASIWPSIDDVP